MASEAATLGVPAVYSGKDFPGYTQELEAANLIRNLKTVSAESLKEGLAWLSNRNQDEAKSLRDQYISNSPDWAEQVLNAIDTHAMSP